MDRTASQLSQTNELVASMRDGIDTLDDECRVRDQHFYQGKLQTARYYFRRELPDIAPQARLLKQMDRTALDMQGAWF